MKTRLIFIRHAQAEGNLTRFFHGWTDSALTDLGHKQAGLAAKRLKGENISAIYSSPLKRAVQTAEYISEETGINIRIDENLKEINGGDWECQPFSDLPVKWPEEYDTWENKPHLHTMPNGESMIYFQNRLLSGVNEILNRNAGKSICIVTHGTSIKALLCHFMECGLEKMSLIKWSDNTAITKVMHFQGSWEVESDGDSSHLGREYSTILNQPWWEEYIKELELKRTAARFQVKASDNRMAGTGGK
ncbi:MAG: histidine phosphatase family protein [Eubacteriales bacterium]|nr:histidine phosphatase family protein [Eubacteriales bacterium]